MKVINKLIALLIFNLVFIINLSAHYDPGAYNHDWGSDQPYTETSSNWMSTIKDDVYLSQVAIPGTHDTATGVDDNKHSDSCRTQPLQATISHQLSSGVRILDLRIYLDNGIVKLRHGDLTWGCGPYIELQNVINEIEYFLDNTGAGETIIIIVKHELDGGLSQDLITKTKDIIQKSKVYKNINFQTAIDDDKKMGALRGKMIVFSRESEFNSLGSSWDALGGNGRTQDNYHVTVNWDVTYKWGFIKEHYKKTTANSTTNGAEFWFNYFNASGGSFPYFVASGHSSNGTGTARLSTGCTTGIKSCNERYADFPKVNCFIGICTYAFESMQRLFITHYKSAVPSPKRTMGIIMLDFPGKEIIETIINDNKRLGLTK